MILHGDSLHELKTLADNSVDTVITDPPYGYSFMGKDWDKAVPSVEIWKECLRVLKPGAFCLVMSAPRSDVQQAMVERLIQGGFRLDFTPIYWTYASGFPKAGNIGKLVDKRLGNERQETSGGRIAGTMGSNTMDGGKANAEYKHSKGSSPLEGSYAGFQPKPAVEVIIVAMKPLSEKTYVDQAMTNGHGVSWLDDGRIPTGDVIHTVQGQSSAQMSGSMYQSRDNRKLKQFTSHDSGRFPANLLVSDDVLSGHSKYFDLDRWYKGGQDVTGRNNHRGEAATHENRAGANNEGVGNSILGGDVFDCLPFLIVPKAAKSEKNKGLDEFSEKAKPTLNKYASPSEGRTAPKNGSPQKNHHPTVKPLKLMSYLITLFSREGDTVLDPFVGSGTTVVAAHQLGRKGIGIEREAEYVEIAKARLKHTQAQVVQAGLFE